MIEIELGHKIRKIRKERGITLDVLNMRTGLSTGYLSKIERGLSSPPIATLSRIASSLGVKLSDFFEDNDDNKLISIVYPQDRKPVTIKGANFGYCYEAIAHKRQNKVMEPFIIRLTPNPNDTRLFVHAGEEMLYLLEGEITWTYGNEKYLIKEPGTCIYIDGSRPHRADCAGEKEALVLVVVSQDISDAPVDNEFSEE